MASNQWASPNDPEGKLAILAISILVDLKKAENWRDVLLELAVLSTEVSEAMDENDRLRAEIYCSFLAGAITGLFEIELPSESRSVFLEHVEECVRDTLESWCMELPRENEHGRDENFSVTL